MIEAVVGTDPVDTAAMDIQESSNTVRFSPMFEGDD